MFYLIYDQPKREDEVKEKYLFYVKLIYFQYYILCLLLF